MNDETTKYKIALLEEYKGTFRILIKIRELGGETYASELDELLPINEKTIRNVRGKLLTSKLIILDERLDPKDKKYRTYLILTEKGKRIAELAEKIENEL